MIYARTILVFALILIRNSGLIQDLVSFLEIGDALAALAAVVIDDSSVMIAGVSMITDWNGVHSPKCGNSRQVYSLTTSSGAWSRLLDLPRTYTRIIRV